MAQRWEHRPGERDARPDQVIVQVVATLTGATHSQLFRCAQAATDALTELYGVGEVCFGAGLRLRPHVTTRSGRLPARACRVPAAADFVLFVPACTPLITLLAKRESDTPSAHHVVIGVGWGGGHTGNSARGTEWRRGGNIVRERGTARPDQVIVHVAATPSGATHSQLFRCAQAATDALTELYGVGEVSFGAGLRLRPHVTTRSGRLPARACRVPAAADFMLFVPARTPLITLLARETP